MRALFPLPNKTLALVLGTAWTVWTLAAYQSVLGTVWAACPSNDYACLDSVPIPCPTAKCSDTSQLNLAPGVTIPGCSNGPAGKALKFSSTILSGLTAWYVCESVDQNAPNSPCVESDQPCGTAMFFADTNCATICRPGLAYNLLSCHNSQYVPPACP